MLSLVILLIGVVFEAAILFRAFLGQTWARYPFFYSYITASLTGSLLLMPMYLNNSTGYRLWFWIVQFATLLLGCGIVLEVFRYVLAPYPGAKRFAKLVVLVGFAVIFLFAIAYSLLDRPWVPLGARFELERNLRTLQAVFLAAILVLISYYRIQLGRNMKGLMRGYIIYVAVSLVGFALRAFAGRSFNVWMFVPPLTYDFCLAIWLVALWSYSPDPVPDPSIDLEADYEALVSGTKTAMGAVRSQLAKAVRP